MIFQLDVKNKSAKALKQTSYTELNIKEEVIEALINDNPTEFLDESIMIIGKQISDWDETNERCDLLGIDQNGKLVVIEVKRDGNQHRDKDVTIQSIKYASYFSTYQMKDVIEQYKKYTNSVATNEDIKRKILQYIDKDDDFTIDNDPRIILIGKEFPPEVTASVLWLREHKINIKCVSIVPYIDNENNVYINRKTIIPLEETEDFMIHRKAKEENKITEQAIREEQIFNSLISNVNKNLLEKSCQILELSQKTDNKYFYFYGNSRYHYEVEISRKTKSINVAFHFEGSCDKEMKDKFKTIFQNKLVEIHFEISPRGCNYQIPLPCKFVDLEERQISDFANIASEKLYELYEIISEFVNEKLFKNTD